MGNLSRMKEYSSNFKSEIRTVNGTRSYHTVCKHCGESVSTGASGKVQVDFTFHHVVKHSQGPVFVNIPAKNEND